MKNAVLKLFGAAFCLFLTSGWEQAVKISDTYGEGGGAGTPLGEKNYAQLFCESDEGARLTMGGVMGWTWKLATVDDYCHHKVQGTEDSFKNGWQRSRLFAGCKLLLNAFDKRVYRCFLFEKSQEYLEIQDRLNLQMQYVGDRSASICAAKESEITQAAGRRYGDIDAALELAQEDERKATEAEQKARDTAKRAQDMLDETLQEVSGRTKLMTILANMFDASFARVEIDIQTFFAEIKKADGTLAGLEGRLKSSDQSFTSLKSLQEETLSSLETVKSSLCGTQKFELEIVSLRGQISHMQSIVDGLEKRLGTLDLPKDFTKDRDHLGAQVHRLRQLPQTRDAIFNASFDLLTERPYVCEKFNVFAKELGKAAHLAKSTEDVKSTVGVIADFKAALEQAEEEASKVAAIEALVNIASDIEVNLMTAIYKGEATRAKLVADSYEADIEAAINQVRLTSLAVDLDRIHEAVTPVKTRMQFVVDSRLSIASAPILLNIRLRTIATKIMRMEMLSHSDPQIAVVWASRKNELLASLNAKVGQDIPRPELKDWSSISNFEAQLLAVEATLDQLSDATKR